MKKLVPWTVLAAMAVGLSALSIRCPEFLSDENVFLHNFVNHELLATLGFIAAVTLASAASLHLELNRIEDETGQSFSRSRKSIRLSAYSLLLLFGLAIVIVVIKPLLPASPIAAALANSGGLLIVFFYLSVMWDLTSTVLSIPTVAKIRSLRRRDIDRERQDN